MKRNYNKNIYLAFFEYQNNNQERLVHNIKSWKNCSYRYMMENAGDIFRELTKEYVCFGYINEKITKILKYILYYQNSYDESIAYSKLYDTETINKMKELWKKQPYCDKFQKLAIEGNLLLLEYKLMQGVEKFKKIGRLFKKYFVGFKYINSDNYISEETFEDLEDAKVAFLENQYFDENKDEEIEVYLQKIIEEETDDDESEIEYETLDYRTYSINENQFEYIQELKIKLQKMLNIDISDYSEIPIDDDFEQIISLRIKDHSWNIDNMKNYRKYNFYLSIVCANNDFALNKFNNSNYFETEYNTLQLHYNLNQPIELVANEITTIINKVHDIMKKHNEFNSEVYLYREKAFLKIFKELEKGE